VGIILLVITGVSVWANGSFMQGNTVAHPAPDLPVPSNTGEAPPPTPEQNRVTHPAPSWPEPSQTAEKPPLTPEQKRHVAELRVRGHARAKVEDWKGCWDAYFEAEGIDQQPPQSALDEATKCKEELDKGDAGGR